MKKSPETLFSEKSLSLKPYAPIEPLGETARRLGIDPEHILKLDANENPYGFSPQIFDAIRKYKNHQIYPDPAQRNLRRLLAKFTGSAENQIVAGAGADEILDLICRLFLNTGDKVLIFEPTFSYYRHLVQLNGGIIHSRSRQENFEIDDDFLESEEITEFKCVFVCSPNNPTGNLLPKEQLEKLMKKVGVVVLDEAYADFADRSFFSPVQKHENLIVVRTFSKLYGLAGLRLGYSVSCESIAEKMMSIKPPYSVTTAGEAALEFCLKNNEIFQEQRNRLVKTREKWFRKLNADKEIFCYPSAANFLLCRLVYKDAKTVKTALEKRGVLIRYFESDALSDCLRISIGTPEQTEPFFSALFEELEKAPAKSTK